MMAVLLRIFACASDAGMQLCYPVLQAMGIKIHRIDDSNKRPGPTGSGANGKVCHQVIPEIAIEMVGESWLLPSKLV